MKNVNSCLSITICLILWMMGLPFAYSAELAKAPFLEALESHKQQAQKQYDEEGARLLSFDDPIYLELRALLDGVVDLFGDYKNQSRHHLDRLLFYVYEIDSDKSQSNARVLNFDAPSKYSGVILKLTADQLKNMNRKILQFIFAHEIGHGYDRMQKRYFILNEDQEYQIPRFTSAQLLSNDRNRPLFDLLDTVGFSTSIKKPVFWLYGSSIFYRLYDKVMSFVEYPEIESSTEEEDEGSSLFDTIMQTHSNFYYDFIIQEGDGPLIEKVNEALKVIDIHFPDLKKMTISRYSKLVGLNEGEVAYLREILLVSEQEELDGMEIVEKRHMVALIVYAMDLYYKRYLADKEYFDSLIPRIRFYSPENISDEMAYKFLKTINILPKDYMEGFLKFTGLTSEESTNCMKNYIDKDIEPPVGALSEVHPSPCWRMYSLKKLHEFYTK